MFPLPGTVIHGMRGPNSLQLEHVIGNGAFGVVFLAHDMQSDEHYAVKFPQVTSLSDSPELDAFKNELRAATMVKHDNVVRVLHVEPEFTHVPPYLVMEYIKGGTLGDVIGSRKSAGDHIEPELLLSISRQIVDGISAINASMLHRDLKPDNILLSEKRIKIGDFGLSKVVGAMTRTNTFKGGQHILYMAPEGWKLEPNSIQIDMYAIGIILFELSTLQYPYVLPDGPLDVEKARKMHLFEQPRPIRSVRTDLPVEFEHIVVRLMEKNPRDRFETWREVGERLDSILTESPTESTGVENRITALLKNIGEVHQARSRESAERMRQAMQNEEQRQLDLYQRSKVLSLLDSDIAEFNRRSALGEIVRKDIGNRYVPVPAVVYSVPNGSSIQVSFFWVEPELRLKNGAVRFAAYVHDSVGRGFNLLLCRENEHDLYGKWFVAHVQTSALVRGRRDVEPFGFDTSKGLREIETADRAMHVYVVKYSDDIAEAFFDLARSGTGGP